jgi:hypothetical protein
MGLEFIIKTIPFQFKALYFAVPQFFEVCVSEPLGVSHHFVKPQKTGAPPAHTIDTALRKGAWPQMAQRSPFTKQQIKLSFHQHILTIPSRVAGGF